MNKESIIILGAGIGGLSVGYLLKNQDQTFTIYESSTHYGGLARSFRWHGVMCDLAPHRLYTQDEALLAELRGLVDYQRQSRKSLIYLQGHWINDPVNPVQLIKKMPFGLSCKLLVSWVTAKLSSNKEPHSFKDFVDQQFGSELNKLFFKPYVEKLFGVPAKEISSEWGRKKVRVSGLTSILKRTSKIYFDQFYYPISDGYGALVDHLYASIQDNVFLENTVLSIEHTSQGDYKLAIRNAAGEISYHQTSMLVSTIPMPALCEMLGYDINLKYKSARLFYLLIGRAKVMSEHWRYFIEENICLNRVSEFKNFSSDHDAPNQTVLCTEVTDEKVAGSSVVIEHLEKIGLIKAEEVLDIKEIYLPQAYPIYSLDYISKMAKAEQFLSKFDGLHVVGRQAQFNHMDVDEIYHSAKNIVSKISSNE